MVQAMSKAEVGDDVYREDPTVDQLEREVAAMMGHESGKMCDGTTDYFDDALSGSRIVGSVFYVHI